MGGSEDRANREQHDLKIEEVIKVVCSGRW